MKTAEILAEQYQIEPVTKVGGLKRAFQVGILGLDSMFQPVSRGFKSAVVAAQAEGKSVPGTVALATLAGIPEIIIGDRGEGGGSFTQGVLNAVLGDGVGDKYREARDAYGPTELTRYIQEKNKGLWHNINQRRKSGKRMRKKGEKGAPSPEAMAQAKASSEMTTTADAGIPHDTKNMGPRIKATTMHDKRRKKDQMPVLLKRFRKYIEDNYG